MKKDKSTSDKGKDLRQRAEKLLAGKSESIQKAPPEDYQKLIHELEVYQIELEMQNEELRRAQMEIEESRSKYSDLYDFAPVGYFTFNQRGQIIEVNLTGSGLLGIERTSLIKMPFLHFVRSEFRPHFLSHCEKILMMDGKEICEVELIRKDKTIFYASLESIAIKDKQGNASQILTAVSDITERKKAEEALQKSEKQLRYLTTELMKAEENERRRVATEIHDGVGQVLATIKFKVEKYLPHVGKNYDKAEHESLKSTIPLIQECIDDVRRIQLDLRPSLLDDLGILPTISWFCRKFRASHSSIRVEENLDIKEVEVPESLKLVIYRIIQEAMNNSATHSQANLIQLSLTKTEEKLELSVKDNGQGFDSEKFSKDDFRSGLGLAGMRERSEFTGGTFSLESANGRGTVIHVSWPV